MHWSCIAICGSYGREDDLREDLEPYRIGAVGPEHYEATAASLADRGSRLPLHGVRILQHCVGGELAGWSCGPELLD